MLVEILAHGVRGVVRVVSPPVPAALHDQRFVLRGGGVVELRVHPGAVLVAGVGTDEVRVAPDGDEVELDGLADVDCSFQFFEFHSFGPVATIRVVDATDIQKSAPSESPQKYFEVAKVTMHALAAVRIFLVIASPSLCVKLY